MADQGDETLDPTAAGVWDDLVWRGLVQVSTDQEALKALLDGPPITFYGGFDPTAPSLHLGNLVLLLTMRRLQLAGHRPIGLVGGSTGLIGDPRPTSERSLHSRDQVAEWVAKLTAQVSQFLDVAGSNGMRLVDNLDWTEPLSAIDFLREIGKHYRVGTMLKKDAVSARLNSAEGISYTEFSYQILQGLDFRELLLRHECVLQLGGSDQWGNLTSGVDLIHRTERVTVHALATPLIVDSDGRKFGKSEGNAVWLDAALTSPFAMHQFWLNTSDADVIDRLKVFTFLSRDEIEGFEVGVRDEPFRRIAQRALAEAVTTIVHGPEAARQAAEAGAALFGQGDLQALEPAVLESALRTVPHTSTPPGAPVGQLLVDTGLVASLGEARRAVAQGGVQVNNSRVTDADAAIITLGASGMAVLRRGKRTVAGVFVE